MHSNTLFSKILSLIDKRSFNKFVNEHDGDKRARTFRCWDQLTVLLFGQIKQCVSGRDTINRYNSHEPNLYHIGSKPIAKSTLNDANALRPCEIFEKLFYSLVQKYQSQFAPQDVKEMITAIDSTQVLLPERLKGSFMGQKDKSLLKIHTVFCLDRDIPETAIVSSACLNDIVVAKEEMTDFEAGRTYVFDKGYYDYGWWLSIDKSKASFVTRLKKNTPIKFIREHSSPCETNIHSDAVIKLATKRVGGGKKNLYQKNIRRVIVTDSEGNTIRLVTNDFDSSAKEISDKYRARWKIELFFKWIKQKLKIKTFYGYSPNAIKTQIYVAMIAYLLLKMAHQRFQTGRSLKTFVRIIAEQLMIRHPEWWRPFAPPKRRDEEKLDPSKQDLFSFHKIPL